MALKMKKIAALPEGEHRGIITAAEETTKVFDPAKGPEPVVAVTIQPAFKDADGVGCGTVSVTYSPSLNGLSGLSLLLGRLNFGLRDGDDFEPSEIVGTEVLFSCKRSPNGFVNIEKGTVRIAPIAKRGK